MNTFTADSSAMACAAAPAPLKRLSRLVPALALTAVAAGCASVPNPNPNDPWEGYNRSMYAFNDTVDRAVLKPIAKGYETVTPQPVRTCIHNMFNNLGDVWSGFNSFLQGRIPDGINTLGRILFNSTMGLGGCIDVASMNGSKRIVNDFGVTLGVWGFDSGPYVVLPFLGSSTVRDGVGTATSLATGLSSFTAVMTIEDVPVRNSILALGVIDLRASLLTADDLVNRTALDKYSFIRDAYLQRRKALVRGMNVDAEAPYSGAELPNYEENALPSYDDPEAAPAPSAAPVSTVPKAAQ
ncbi:MAG TPA: VacJ family lipoprotein [Eoetvoesiella sp.]